MRILHHILLILSSNSLRILLLKSLLVVIYKPLLILTLNSLLIIIFLTNVQLPEEVELVWDDSVAPETCIDFDAAHISTNEVFGTFAFAFAAIFGLYTIISVVDPASLSPVAPRSAVIPPNTVNLFLGIDIAEGGEDAEEEEAEEDDE